MFDISSQSMRTHVGKLKQQLKPKLRNSDNLRIFLVFVFAVALLTWLILIVFISSNDEGDSLNFEGKELNEIRDGLFFSLFLVIVLLGFCMLSDGGSTTRLTLFASSDFLPQPYFLLHAIAHILFALAVSVTMFDMRETGRPVLIILIVT